MSKIHLEYENATDDIANINKVISNVEEILNNISALYSQINNGDIYNGYSASQYEETFNTLKKTAFVRVPEITKNVNNALAIAKDDFAKTETAASNAANGN